jgi:plastocyanin
MKFMKKDWPVLIVVCLCFGLLLPLHNLSAQGDKIKPELKTSDHKVISLKYTFGPTPATATVKQGTTVIWMNGGRSSAKIKFTSKQVAIACKSPVHFVVDEQGTFISNEIPPGAVARLCFVEKGKFDYIVTQETPQTAPTEAPKEFKGKIIVQ